MFKAVLIEGDGIGPEVCRAAVRVLESAGAKIEWEKHLAGLSAIDAGSAKTLPDETVQAIRSCGIALKGPCTTPIGGGFSSVNVALRKANNLYAAVRPVRSLDGVPTRFSNVDIIVVRENTEGLYAGIENEITPGVVTSLKVATRTACLRIAEYAYRMSLARGRHKVTVFHKANIMKMSDGLFIRCAKEVWEAKYSNQLEYEEIIIDAACMRLVQDPTRFDVVLMENLYGDVISDLCAGLVGGLGVTPGANIGDEAAVFEAVHGSAPDIAGKGIANPLAIIMSGVMMLNHVATIRGIEQAKVVADRIRNAYNAALHDGMKTRDLGGTLSTEAFSDALIARLN
ncbi:MAG: isocitrate/isopropylmalate dehydrogenase family protein [Planctomycetota bacterium]|nr:isocitrate/isopropylmalate dehydrogenase family protein [Planctomycetota bacterium]